MTWSSRWDYILESLKPADIKWYGIINSLVIVIFMTGMIGMILLRTLHRDIARYNQETMVRMPPVCVKRFIQCVLSYTVVETI